MNTIEVAWAILATASRMSDGAADVSILAALSRSKDMGMAEMPQARPIGRQQRNRGAGGMPVWPVSHRWEAPRAKAKALEASTKTRMRVTCFQITHAVSGKQEAKATANKSNA